MRSILALLCGIMLLCSAASAHASSEDMMTRSTTLNLGYKLWANDEHPFEIDTRNLFSDLAGTPKYYTIDFAYTAPQPGAWTVQFNGSTYSLDALSSLTQQSLPAADWANLFASDFLPLVFSGTSGTLTLSKITVNLHYAATPIPAAALLLGSGIAGIGILRRRMA